MRGPALVLLAVAALLAPRPAPAHGDDARLPLAAGWAMQSSKQVAAAGPELSRPGFSTAGWYAVRVPNTVLGAMVDAGSLPDPYFGMNLRLIPGTTYKIGERFTLLPTPADSPFKPAWWYRTEFDLPATDAGRPLKLHFDGINYRANIWMNGTKIAGATRSPASSAVTRST